MHRAVWYPALALVAGVGLVLGGATAAGAQDASAVPEHLAPWPCGEERDYYHHANEVSNAIDYAIPGGGLGTPALASADGTIVSAGWNGGYGNEVVIDHGEGFASQYAHLDSIGVEVGQPVAVGEQIGEVGSTGNSTGPHLHYEQLEAGERIPITIDGVPMNYDGATHHHISGNC